MQNSTAGFAARLSRLWGKKTLRKRLAAAAIFVLLGIGLGYEEPTREIAWVSSILLLTIYLFAFEIVSVDVAAITIMVILGLTSVAAPWIGLDQGLVDPQRLFDGFSSNAVMSIIAVMIIGAGLDKTGIMNSVAALILRWGGETEKRIIPIISSTVAFISSFMQNVGAAALFLPVVSRISVRTGLPMSRLLMPMGFCAILGGTVTMVGSSPLILLNDLMLASNTALPADQQMETWSLFSVTPIGIALVITGILYFVLAGRFVLPAVNLDDCSNGVYSKTYFRDVYGVEYDIFEIYVPESSPLVGARFDDVEPPSKIRIVASKARAGLTRIGPGAHDRDSRFEARMMLGVVAAREDVERFIAEYKLRLRSNVRSFGDELASTKAGMAEIVIPPASQLIGKSARDVWMRKTYGLAMVGLHRDGKTMKEGDDIRSQPLEAGDTLVVHTTWETLARIEKDRNFVVITADFPHEDLRPHKIGFATAFFGLALFLVLFTDLRLSIALMSGAIGMIISGVIKVEEAYQAVSWKTVFLLASLIPLGLAVEQTGTAKWIADQTLLLVGELPIWGIQFAIAILATFFTLVMSNVGATVLLVPLAVNIAIGVGANPAVFALIVAVATSNSFIIPTHQVNALIMGPAGYRVPDFLKAGGIMTMLFLVVLIVMINLVY